MNHKVHIFILFFLCTVITSLITGAHALPSSVNITLEELRSRRSALESAPALTADQKKEAVTYIDQAMGYLQLQTLNQKKINELAQQIASAPARLKKVTADLGKPLLGPAEKDLFSPKDDIDRIEQRFRQNEAQLASAQTLYKEHQDRLALELSAINQIPELISSTQKRLEEIDLALGQPAGEIVEPEALTQARTLSLRAEKRHLKTESTLNQQRQNGHNLITDLLRGERDLAEQQVAYHEQILRRLTERIQSLRNEEAAQQIENAQNALLKTSLQPETVQAQFDVNVQLSVELEKIAGEETDLRKRLDEYQQHLKTTEMEFETAKRRVELDVLTDVIGMALRSQRVNLPSSERYELNSKKYLTRMSDISERHFQLDRMLQKMPTVEELIAAMDMDSQDRTLVPRVERLLKSRQELILKITSGYERIIKLIQDIEFTKKKVLSVSQEFGELLDRHLLWIESSKPFSLEEAAKLAFLAKDLLSPGFWKTQLDRLIKTLSLSPLYWFLGICSGILLVSAAGRGKKRLTDIATDIDRQTDDTILLTIQALGLTLLVSLIWPYLFLFPAIQVSDHLNKDLIGNIPNPLSYTWILIFWLVLFNVCRPSGLAQVHFRWPETIRSIFRTHLAWLIPVESLVVLLYYLMETNVGYEHRLLLGMIAISTQCMALSAFGAIAFGFDRGVTSVLLKKYPDTWFCRLRYIWYPAMVLIPLYIFWLALSGFYFSAIEARELIYKTILLFFGLVVLNSLILRLLLLARRRIALKKAMEGRSGQQTQQPQDKQTKEGRPSVMETVVRLSAIDEQTRSLLKLFLFALGLVGLWTIWAPVLPAFGILQDIEFWSYTAVVNGVETIVPITLANIVLAGMVTFAMMIAVRNLPGLIEVILLNHLPMDAGARYAYIAVSRYAIVALGLVIALGAIGIKWSNMQWLVAALSVGLGFGLQEIVANFISGLIVLFERPFSVGDTVTVGDVNGTVTRIRIRATTIEDWDKKELIVPNKEFITGRLINWSLSDNIIRIKVPVGIAYGSDTDLAEKLLMKAAKENPYVLSTPKPTAVFLRFGDNSLDFEVRVFIKGIDDWIPMLHSINQAINKSFAAHKITIAFPQRDVHLDASEPIPVKMVAEDTV